MGGIVLRVVVTGATGFVGKWLVRELLKKNIDVIALVRNPSRAFLEWNNEVKLVSCALDEMKLIRLEEIITKPVQLFFHLAWAGTSGLERSDEKLQLKNVEYACAAVRLAKELGCRKFINAGSIMEYEAMNFIPSDGSQPGLGNIYSTAKLTADFMAKTVATNLGLTYCNIIISNIFGPGEKSARFFNSILRKMLTNEAIPLTHGHQTYDFIYASDAATAILEVGFKGKNNEAYYIGNSTQRTLKEFVREMRDTVGSESELQFGKVPFNGTMLTYREFDTDKIEKQFGFKPEVDFKTGVLKTKEWIETEG
jgi:UDP-glucose 4-epimerase